MKLFIAAGVLLRVSGSHISGVHETILQEARRSAVVRQCLPRSASCRSAGGGKWRRKAIRHARESTAAAQAEE